MLGVKPVSLFACVTRGQAPVIGAKVVATIESSTGRKRKRLIMRDSGANADIIKDDGIYSAYILNADSVEKHTISVEVSGEASTKILNYKKSGGAGSITGYM